METGFVLNENLRLGIIEYINKFCDKQVQITQENSIKDLNSVFSANEIEDLKLSFVCDMYEKEAFKKKSKIKAKKKLDKYLLKELEDNLIDLSQNSNLNITNSGSSVDMLYLLYFCSNYITSNSTAFNNVIQFLNSMQEKLKCTVKILFISSDGSEEGYHKLISKMMNSSIANDESSAEIQSPIHRFDRYALSYKAKSVKEKLFQQMNVVGIPWLSLINSTNGEILCENLNIFILNNQLKDMIF